MHESHNSLHLSIPIWLNLWLNQPQSDSFILHMAVSIRPAWCSKWSEQLVRYCSKAMAWNEQRPFSPHRRPRFSLISDSGYVILRFPCASIGLSVLSVDFKGDTRWTMSEDRHFKSLCHCICACNINPLLGTYTCTYALNQHYSSSIDLLWPYFPFS